MRKESDDIEASSGESCLTLGWQVTLGQDPRYWLSNAPKPGLQSEDELIRVPAHSIGNHTAIIAQSGSGKSFFLGRIIEEIMLQTRARCVILDPNADFRKIQEVEDAELWNEAKYNPLERSGKLPHEASREEFASRWSTVSFRIRTGTGAKGDYEQLQIWWPSLSMTFLAEDLNPMLRSDLYHCHAFVQDFGRLFEIKYRKDEIKDLLEESQNLFRRARTLTKENLRFALNQEFNANQIITGLLSDGKSSQMGDLIFLDEDIAIKRSEIDRMINRFIERALTVAEYVSIEVERFYFGKAREYQTAGIIQTRIRERPWARPRSERLEVIDLPSVPDIDTRLLAINAVLTTEWERARHTWSLALEKNKKEDKRVPTFIVVDEAHNLIPKDTRNRAEAALRDQFRTIVAEGRKYGLFLILVSQRPDKLDPLVLSECENKAVMKLGSASVLDITRQMLGLDDLPPKLLEKCLEFETGRVLLVGRWSPDRPKIIYSAARRTVEGGRNLREDYWAVSSEVFSKSTESGDSQNIKLTKIIKASPPSVKRRPKKS